MTLNPASMVGWLNALDSSLVSDSTVAVVGDPTTGQTYTAALSQLLRGTQGGVNVKAAPYSATGDGSTNDQPRLTAAYAAATVGDQVIYPRGTYNVLTTVLWNKSLSHRSSAIGEGGGSAVVNGSIISGSGTTLVQMTDACVVDGLCIKDPTGNTSTIGLDIVDATNGVVNWVLRNVYINAPHTVKLGTGLRCIWALKGKLIGPIIEGWNIGVDLQSTGGQKSNANAFLAPTIRVNTIGIKTTDVDDVFIDSGTIEGNATGIKHESGTLTVSKTHFEQSVGVLRSVHITGGTYVSIQNGYYCSSTPPDLDIYVESGSGKHLSIGDTFNYGIKHNGTGLFLVINPVNGVPTTSGTGPVIMIDGNGIRGLQNCTTLDYAFAGFLRTRMEALLVTAGADASTTATIGGGGGSPTTTRTALLVLDAPHSGSFTGSANTRLRRNGTEIWNVGINSAVVSGIKSAITDYYAFDGTNYCMALTATKGRLRTLGAMAGAPITVTYSASMTIDAETGNLATITATNGTAFTINAPTNPTSGQRLRIRIRNTSGGALGVATWNAVFKMGAAWTQPATGFSRSIDFDYDGTNWVEASRAAADVAN